MLGRSFGLPLPGVDLGPEDIVDRFRRDILGVDLAGLKVLELGLLFAKELEEMVQHSPWLSELAVLLFVFVEEGADVTSDHGFVRLLVFLLEE